LRADALRVFGNDYLECGREEIDGYGSRPQSFSVRLHRKSATGGFNRDAGADLEAL
jgi:hypothetical protein